MENSGLGTTYKMMLLCKLKQGIMGKTLFRLTRWATFRALML